MFTFDACNLARIASCTPCIFCGDVCVTVPGAVIGRNVDNATNVSNGTSDGTRETDAIFDTSLVAFCIYDAKYGFVCALLVALLRSCKNVINYNLEISSSPYNLRRFFTPALSAT